MRRLAATTEPHLAVLARVGLAAGALAGTLAGARPLAAWPRLQGAAGVVERWAPEYTRYLPLPGYDGAVSLAVQDGSLWLATETEVSRLEDAVWQPPAAPPEVDKIFALAPVGRADLWAFGLNGEAWSRVGGTWAAVPSPAAADLYGAVARRPDDVWAVGFDYEAERGTLVHFDGDGLEALAPDWLGRKLLFSVALDTTGELWAGGCDYSGGLVLLRDGRSGRWTRAEAPAVSGCVYGLSFSADGLGLAAAGDDVLLWSGSQWTASGLAPPAGSQWVRVAGTSALEPPPEGQYPVPGAGWAIAGTPTWRSYTEARTPWYFDGASWREANVDYRGLEASFVPTEENPEARPFVNLATDGRRAWSVSRIGGAGGASGVAAVMSLEAGVVRFSHPLLVTPWAIAAPSADRVWVGGEGAAPLLRFEPDDPPVPDPLVDDGGGFVFDAIDFADPDIGWAVGGVVATDTQRTSWQWSDGVWTQALAPPWEWGITQMRALPDGGAWGAGGRIDRIVTYEVDGWTLLDDSPILDRDRPLPNRASARNAPFDVVGTPDGPVGCVAGRDAMYRFAEGGFRAVGGAPRGQVLDLQLVDEQSGWAIAVDERNGPGETTGALLRLRGCRAVEERLRVQLPRLPASAVNDVDWALMSAVSADEVWLFGSVRAASTPFPIRTLVGVRAGGAKGYLAPSGSFARDSCSLTGIAAVAAEGGTDVWMLSPAGSGCGPSPSGPLPSNYAGPVSRLVVRPATDRIVLPFAARFRPAEAER